MALPAPLLACVQEDLRSQPDPNHRRLTEWSGVLREEGLGRYEVPMGQAAVRVGELAGGSPYQAYTLETYLKAGGTPHEEPLTLSLTHFDCVTLVEACLAVARLADDESPPTWERFGREVERMRYRGGRRLGYTSRLHYFSEWITDGERRGLVQDRGGELGAAEDRRPLRFMSEHRGSYPALANDSVFQEIRNIERRLDGNLRRVVPTKRIPEVVNRIDTGDVLGFATEIPGLDVSHTALAYRDREGVLRVLHAPLSGGVVEVTRATLPEYVAAIRRATGILVVRPLRAEESA
ncbi:MAG TPA: N-acetylmuramoyl-L-alanine amidase-like domain-containing protein [Gemmatimonadales bacterium]|nr:N-acetylmuramoyl-L-alanine amidase-like domain-containing protein [Gemmatimonadales bacterium]